MFKRIVINLSVFLLVLLSHEVKAETAPIDKLKAFLANTRSLTADFKQVTLNESGQAAQASRGVFYLSRPGKFRWSYKTPFEQEIVSNVGKVW
ncbi:MAG: outer membrane lipoprotein carrier protein LolA, partial [Methylomarinum sp.]|nr:outer membrane lipoprotein carrier protein LolA [Methylomarinum sp.]